MEQTTLQDGKYEILHEIGQGGMAVVYKGHDTSLDREVAVKVLHPHLANRADSRMRLQREARAVAKLHHPNILEIYAYSGLDSELSYIVTEYIRGETLKDFTDRHTPSLPEIGAMLVHEVADALAHAHEHGIIHRDIKPENIMIRDDGVLKLMDFGIAQIVDMQQMTVTGALVGSPAHMSPEHVEGKPLDFRADVFSLGTMLYFLCAGRLPFDSPSPHALLRQILEAEFDDPRRHNPAISRRLCGIITKCLARDPDDRYDSVERLRDELASYLTPLGFDDPAEELALFFEDPSTVEASLTRRVVETLMTLAERDARSGKVAVALEYYNQVLALEGDREDALAQVQRLSSSQTRYARLKWVAVAAGVIGTIALAVSLTSGSPEASLPALESHIAELPRSAVAVRPAVAPRAAEPETKRVEDGTSVAVAKPAVAAPVPVLLAEPRLAEADHPAPRRQITRVLRIPTRIKFGKTRRPAPRPVVKPAAPKPERTAGAVQVRLMGSFGSGLEFRGKPYTKGDTGTLALQPGAYRIT
ncbi:MAG: serine/threonine protein kinase, partial [Myxococcota bacterium]